jgi:hypothetical protein
VLLSAGRNDRRIPDFDFQRTVVAWRVAGFLAEFEDVYLTTVDEIDRADADRVRPAVGELGSIDSGNAEIFRLLRNGP